MKKIYTLLLLFFYINANSQSTTVVISQVYPGGGSPNATVLYKYDYVELHNISSITQSISNFSLQYGSATGNFGNSASQIYGFPAAASIPAGGYLLIQLGTAGTAGADLPVTPDYTSLNLNLGGTSGKIALVNSAVPLACGATGSLCTLPSANIIDIVAWGTSNNGEGGVTAGTVTLTSAAVRKLNGCQDTDNNATDFDIIENPVPHNASTPVSTCGPAGPVLSANPSVLNITTTTGTASVPQSYNLTGSNLTGFPGNITVTAGAGLQVSFNSGSGYANSIILPYSSASIAATQIFVRIISGASQGALNSTVTNSGGGASNSIVTVSGGVYQNYYNTKGNDGLNEQGTWSTTIDGTGTTPVDFTSGYQLFNIINEVFANYNGEWEVSGAGNSRIILGNGTDAINFIIPAGIDSITSATKIDVLNNATLTIQNNRKPFLNNLATGSTVDFAQAGVSSTDTIRIPAISFFNLKLTNGLKYFSANTTTVRGELTASAVAAMNGSSPTFSTINAFGNVNFINNSHFEPLPSGDAARITLSLNGNGNQLISGTPGEDILLFRLQRDTITSNSTIALSSAALVLGNSSGGGLRLNQGNTTTTTLVLGGHITLIGAGVITPAATGKIFGSEGFLDINKSSGTSNAGTLRFTTGSTLIRLTVAMGSSFARDSIIIADSLGVQTLGLNKGKIVVNSNAVLTSSDFSGVTSGNVIGGSPLSFVDGKFRRRGLVGFNFSFPIGKGNKYAPVDINHQTPTALDYTAEYFPAGYGNYTIDPATLSSFPTYNVSQHEYWTIERGNIPVQNADLTFYYTDGASGILNPSQLKVAHFDGTDWDDLGGTANAANTTTNGSVTVTGVSTFSPFTFAGRLTGVIPVQLSSFTVQKLNSSVKISWTTQQEINSDYFIVERSLNARDWTAIGTVNASGNSNIPLHYSMIDHAPANGINFYRLRQVDRNARTDYSDIKSILFNSIYQVLITPNPATDIIHVYISRSNNSVSEIYLYEANGKLVKTYPGIESLLQIPTAGLPKGLYFLKIINADKVVTEKIILQ